MWCTVSCYTLWQGPCHSLVWADSVNLFFQDYKESSTNDTDILHSFLKQGLRFKKQVLQHLFLRTCRPIVSVPEYVVIRRVCQTIRKRLRSFETLRRVDEIFFGFCELFSEMVYRLLIGISGKHISFCNYSFQLMCYIFIPLYDSFDKCAEVL